MFQPGKAETLEIPDRNVFVIKFKVLFKVIERFFPLGEVLYDFAAVQESERILRPSLKRFSQCFNGLLVPLQPVQ